MHEAILWKKLDGDKVHCYLCSHNCHIDEGEYGFCGMRQNKKGELFTHAYGRVIANHVDPIEKKPLYHFLPGTDAYSIATIGCNFRCSFCQNWSISQVSVRSDDMEGHEMAPGEVVTEAVKSRCRSISYTYTEPTVFFEYARDIAELAKKEGLYNTFVTNGYMTKAAVKEMASFVDAANVDLKFFSDQTYTRICGGKLAPVLDSIAGMKKAGIWVEVTTLIVPGENDAAEELKGIASFIAETDRDIPWHVSRFHPDYKYTDSHATPVLSIQLAVDIGKSEGLNYIYPGNVATLGETLCPGCGKMLITREGFAAEILSDFDNGKCAKCGTEIAGIWR